MSLLDGWNSTLYVGAYNLTDHIKSGKVSRKMDMNERTAWGNAGWRSFRRGLQQGTVSLEGFDDEGDGAGVDGIAEVIRAAMALSGGQVVTVSADTPAVAGACVMLEGYVPSYETDGDFESIRTNTIELQSSGRLGDGVWLKTLAAETASTNGTTVNNGAATTGGYEAHQHITAKSGTDTPTLTTDIEHSTDGNTWGTLVSFTAATAVGAERITGTGTVNQYRRRKSTISGTNPSFTHAVSLATW